MADIPDRRVEFDGGKYALLREGPGRFYWQRYDEPPEPTYSNRDISIFYATEDTRTALKRERKTNQELFNRYHECIEALRSVERVLPGQVAGAKELIEAFDKAARQEPEDEHG